MGIFDYIKNGFLGRTKTVSELPETKDRRFNVRYKINDPNLVTVRLSSGGEFKLRDLSYAGCFVEGYGLPDESSFPCLLELSAFGEILEVEADSCHRRENGWAIIFQHPNSSSLKKVGAIIELVRSGDSAIPVSADPVKDGDSGDIRHRFIGDGPFDLVVEEKHSGEISFFMVTLRRGGEYGSVIFKDGRVITKKVIDVMGVSARMAQTKDIDKSLVVACALSCLGLQFPQGASCAKLLKDYLDRSEPRDHTIAG